MRRAHSITTLLNQPRRLWTCRTAFFLMPNCLSSWRIFRALLLCCCHLTGSPPVIGVHCESWLLEVDFLSGCVQGLELRSGKKAFEDLLPLLHLDGYEANRSAEETTMGRNRRGQGGPSK